MLDADLRRSLRRTSLMRQCFYAVVLLVALAGQVSGAVQALNIAPVWAVPAVTGLELGGMVVLASANVRRRLGERAIAARLLSASIAVWAVAFNWLAHRDHLVGGFFAAMSCLGYLVWLMHSEAERRDRLRATGDLPPTPPAYELFTHWLRHPRLTLRAKSLAKSDPDLGLYGSLAAARDEIRREHRQRAIATVLHRKVQAAIDPLTADIAVAVYDLDEVAARLAEQADYATLTALIARDLAPARLAAASTVPSESGEPDPTADPATPRTGPATGRANAAAGTVERHLHDVPAGASPAGPAGTHPSPTGTAAPPVYEPTSDEDAVMYRAWRTGVTAGQEPSGVDLARAAGRPDDATGVGRRAARRYREAHARDSNGAATAGHGVPAANMATAGPRGTAPQHTGGAHERPHNGNDLTSAGAAR